MRIHIVANRYRTDAVTAVIEAAEWLRAKGIEVGCDQESAGFTGLPEVPDREIADADLVISFGGDGTVIRAAHLCSEKGTPIIGVYYGRFGFVTQCQAGELAPCLSAFLDGGLELEERMMLQAELHRQGQVVATIHALNDVVIQRAITTRMLTFEVVVDGQRLTSYPADGVLVATPTGSTGYNLSAGGPVLDPNMEALVLTAVAPHTLSARPLVLGPKAQVELQLKAEGEAIFTVDGQSRFHLLSGDVVSVRRSPRVTRLVCVEKHDFLIKLSERLLWSRGPSE